MTAERALAPRTVSGSSLRSAEAQLLWTSFPYFMSRLIDVDGTPIEVAVHHERWCRLMAEHARLVLLAPRSHGKTTAELAYILWQCYRHGADRLTGRTRPDPGDLQIVLFSATADQAGVLMARLRDLLAANADLLASASAGPRPLRASSTWVRLASGASIRTRAFHTSVRGLHPDILILDDVLNDLNTGSQEQRDKVWGWFTGTLFPMRAGRILVVGTAMHADDLAHRLAGPAASERFRSGQPLFGFHVVREAALDEETRTTLWPERISYEELAGFRDAEPLTFAREYQNDVRDDHASLFPSSLTQIALGNGADLILAPAYRRDPREVIVLGADLALSEAIGADYTVVLVVAWNVDTHARRLIAARREKGLLFNEQVALIIDMIRSFGVQYGVVEQNGFQRWLIDELALIPEGVVIHGHSTGRSKADVLDGVPMLKMPLLERRWTIPCGDPSSLAFARQWQSELAAFSWRENRMRGLGEHDDIVMATWFVELAIRQLRELLKLDTEEIVTMEQLGIRRVKIGHWDD